MRSSMNKTGSQRASRQRAPPVVCRVLFWLDWVLRRPDWVLAKHLFISFSAYSFHLSTIAALPLPPSLPLTLSLNWGQGPLGLCSIVPQENCQSGATLWLNTESRSFIKKLICYSLPLACCFSFHHFPSLPFFLAHAALLNQLPGPFFPLSLSLPAVSPSPLGVSHGAAFLPSRRYCVGDSNVMANTVITSWFTEGSALPGSIICSRGWGSRGRRRALQEITPQYNIANLRNDREAITQETSRFREERLQLEGWRWSAVIKEFRERLWV